MLPGESLAKYRGEGGEIEEGYEAETEAVSDLAAEPPAEPQPELAEATDELEDVAMEPEEELASFESISPRSSSP